MSPAASDNVLPLRAGPRSPEVDRARTAANQVRFQLSLLQGYADLMEGLSPQQNVNILKVMATKIKELTDTLQPFLENARSQGWLTLEDYREVRLRNQQLMSEYRFLLKRLRQSVRNAQNNLPQAP